MTLAATGSREVQERGGVVRVSLWLLEMSRSNFEKIKSKNFKKATKPRLRKAGGVGDQIIC